MTKTHDRDEPDWFDGLTEEQQQGVIRGLEQADRGEVIPHEEAMISLGLIESSDAENSNK